MWRTRGHAYTEACKHTWHLVTGNGIPGGTPVPGTLLSGETVELETVKSETVKMYRFAGELYRRYANGIPVRT